MLDEQFRKQRAELVRDLADKADPFIKQRLLGLAERYEGAERPTRSQTPPPDMRLSDDHSRRSEG